MTNIDWAAWAVIIGLSGIAVGGLLLWAYGDSVKIWMGLKTPNDERTVQARKQFTGVLVYSVVMIVVGIGLALQGALYIFS